MVLIEGQCGSRLGFVSLGCADGCSTVRMTRVVDVRDASTGFPVRLRVLGSRQSAAAPALFSISSAGVLYNVHYGQNEFAGRATRIGAGPVAPEATVMSTSWVTAPMAFDHEPATNRLRLVISDPTTLTGANLDVNPNDGTSIPQPLVLYFPLLPGPVPILATGTFGASSTTMAQTLFSLNVHQLDMRVQIYTIANVAAGGAATASVFLSGEGAARSVPTATALDVRDRDGLPVALLTDGGTGVSRLSRVDLTTGFTQTLGILPRLPRSSASTCATYTSFAWLPPCSPAPPSCAPCCAPKPCCASKCGGGCGSHH